MTFHPFSGSGNPNLNIHDCDWHFVLGGRSTIYDVFGTFSLTVPSETWSDRSGRSPAEAIALCPTCPVRSLSISQKLLLYGDKMLETIWCLSARVYARQDLTRSTRFFHVKQLCIPFRSCLQHCLTVEMVKVQNGFPDHKDSNRLWLLSFLGFWQSYILEPKWPVFEGQPSKRRPKLQSKQGVIQVILGSRLSLHRFHSKKAVWLFPSAEAHLNPIDRGLLDWSDVDMTNIYR